MGNSSSSPPEFQPKPVVWPTETKEVQYILLTGRNTPEQLYRKSEITSMDSVQAFDVTSVFTGGKHQIFTIKLEFNDGTMAQHPYVETVDTCTKRETFPVVLTEAEQGEILKAYAEQEKPRFARHQEELATYWLNKNGALKPRLCQAPPTPQ
jgi:hypothetical protein